MPETKHSHILKYWFRDDPSQRRAQLFRACDGLLIGLQQQETVIYGEEPKRREGRVFMDGNFGQKFLIEVVAKNDLHNCGEGAVLDVDIRCMDGSVILTPSSLEMPGFGSPFKA